MPASVDDLHVESRGDGPVVVLAHGFAGSARNFRPQVRALEASYRVVVYDAPGHARSAVPAEYGLATFVDAFERVVEATGAERVVAGGLSLGAATALHAAMARPERLRGLVLLSMAPGRGAPGSVSAGALEFAAAIERRGLEAAGERFVWGADSGLDPAAGRLVRQGFLEHPAEALAGCLRGVLSELPGVDELASRLCDCALPSLVIAGADDPGSLEPSRRLAETLPNATLVVVPEAGHVVNLARPAEVNDALLRWLAELPR